MQKAHNFELEDTAPATEQENEETLAAIDEGLRDAESGNTVSSEHIRNLLPKWISDSSTHKKH